MTDPPALIALPVGWKIGHVQAATRALSPCIDLIYAGPPRHHCRVWLVGNSRELASWLWPILDAVATAPVAIEMHVWADKPE